MNGQKQKRPYKRRLESVNGTAEIHPEPILSGRDKAEQIGRVTSVDAIGQDDNGFAVTMSLNTPAIEECFEGAGEFVMLKPGQWIDEEGAIQSPSIDPETGWTKTESGMMPPKRQAANLTAETVRRVESAVGRTSNAWGMVDPLELIRAVDRVLRGGEG